MSMPRISLFLLGKDITDTSIISKYGFVLNPFDSDERIKI